MVAVGFSSDGEVSTILREMGGAEDRCEDVAKCDAK